MDHHPLVAGSPTAELFDAISAFELASQMPSDGSEHGLRHEHKEDEPKPKTMKDLLPSVLAAYEKLEFQSYAFPTTADNYVDTTKMKAALLRGKILYAIAIAGSGKEGYYNTMAVRAIMGNLKPAEVKAELQEFSKLLRSHVVIDGKAVVDAIESIKGILEFLHTNEGAKASTDNHTSSTPANEGSYHQQGETEYDFLIDLDDIHPRSQSRRISSTFERQLDSGISPQVSTYADICAPDAVERIIKVGEIVRPLHNLALRFGAVKPGDRVDIQLSMILSCAARLHQFHNAAARASASQS
ncbi:hypothetical protein BU16DRAFT_526544, partial [Lophium mytilinum]